MLITARAEYACLAMLELAQRHGEKKPVRLADVAEKHAISQRFLVQILLQMKAAGLVTTTRGASGGYLLTKSPIKITLADIFSVLDRMEEPVERSKTPSPMSKGLQNVWKGMAQSRLNYLKQIRLTDLLPTSNITDYVI